MTDAPWVEPVVSKEKLLFLLAMGTEFPQLDFKQKVDLDEHSELVELAKDVAALQSCGGYLVIGVDDTGKPTEMQSEALAKKFDEANLRQKLENHLVLIHVERHPLGFSVIAKPGEYQAADGRPKVVLRPGDVFIRRGTSSQRWSEDDVEDLLAPRDARLKELHRKDFAALAVELQTGMRGESLASGPANALTWQLDGNTFEATIVETLRHGDMVPIRLFLARALGEATTFAQRADHESFDTITDRLTSLSAIALTVGHDELCHGVVAGLGDLYRSKVFREEGPSNVAGYWLSLITRATALGGLAVHLKKWPVVRQIAMEPSGDDHYGSWLRHGITIEARAHAFPRVDNDDEFGGLIPPARRTTHALPALRPYLPDDEEYDPSPGSTPSEFDPALDNLCGFDALSALIYTTSSSSNSVAPYYPSFGFYYARRSEDYWARLLKDPGFREALMPNTDIDSIEDAMLRVSEDAGRVHRNGMGPWHPSTADVDAAIRSARTRQIERQYPGSD